MRKRIGLLGGTFNPIHDGHLAVAKSARKQYHLDEVWFVVANISPFKTGETIPSFNHRLNMVNLAIAPYRKFKVSTIEETLPTPSYTVDTLTALTKRWPQTDFYWIIGADQAIQFSEWREPEKIKTLATVIVYPRIGAQIPEGFSSIKGEFADVSSTAIRAGQSRKTPSSVLRYLMENNLYTENMLRTRVSEHRLSHILSMTDCAWDIACHYGLQEHLVKCTGLMHDYAKDMTTEIDYQWLKTAYPHRADQAKALWHATIASAVLSQKYYVKNKHVKRAIEGHVEGLSTTPLGMILYIADKCDPGRGLHREAIIALAKVNLPAAFKQTKALALMYRKGKINGE